MRSEIIDEAQLREAEIKEQGETKLFYINPEQKEIEKPEILVGARDMGCARLLAPVIEELLHRGYPISFLADQPAEDFLKSRFEQAKELSIGSPLGAIAVRDPGLILSGISATGGPGTEFYLAKTAEGYGENNVKQIPSVWVEDLWGVATRQGQIDYPVKPDFICAFDEHSKALDIAHLKEAGISKLSSDQLIVTGSPAFDDIVKEQNHAETQKKLRKELKINKEEIFITYMCGTPPEDIENLKILINNLNQINLGGKKIALAVRIHPGIFMDGPLARYKEDYKNILDSFNNGRIIETMGKFSTDEVAISTDVVISIFSTEGIKAVYRGKPSLFMLLSGLGADKLEKLAGMKTLPVIESGASLGVFQEEDLKRRLEKLLDPEYQRIMQAAQRAHHYLDGNNARRVVEVIERILSR